MAHLPVETPTTVPMRRSPVRSVAAAFACLLVVLGVAGFVPGVTTDLTQLSVAGPGSGAMLFGSIQVSVLHNLVNAAAGVWGLTAIDRPIPARSFLLGAGVAYLALWLYGMFVEEHSVANVLPADAAGTILHAALGLGMVITALLLGRGTGMGTGSNLMAR
ncbi:protein of unknown function [Haloechinothrix alba]|uniref:DUF4383 domain-containing protein n=1 Tax=Haloechinothrix alba TaxID=664784 RepID=A0A238XBE0_9PSEU|nr:DUF4383 domain-containing protein [Haloechinothrix alba]SNR55863.1 protein of unknown function [Haloechinothrix alba]